MAQADLKRRIPVFVAVLLLGSIAARMVVLAPPKMELPFDWPTTEVVEFFPSGHEFKLHQRIKELKKRGQRNAREKECVP